jgi:broad specificity phosphatase PhoE
MATQLICLRHAESEPPSWDSSRIIASYLGAQIDVVPALAEVSMGSGDREPTKPGLAAAVLRQWIVGGDLGIRLMDGETGHEVALRMKSALTEISEMPR